MNKKNNKHTLFYTIFILIIVFTLGTPSHAFSLGSNLDASQVKPCKGLDLVLLVSYSSPTLFNIGNGLRQRVMRTTLDILGDNSIYLCPGIEHRIAVVGFGDQEDKTALDWDELVTPTTINPSLSKLGEWTDQKYKMFQLIPPEGTDLGRYSNFRDGLQKSSDILAEWRKKGFDPSIRQQAVLIISDGDMCTWEHDCNFDSAFQDILPIVDPSSKHLSAGVAISHIGFYTLAGGMFQFWEQPKIFEFWSNITQQHSGKLFLLQSGRGNVINQDIDSKVSAVLNDLLGSDLGAARCNNAGNGIEPIWVEPYQNNFLILYVYRYGASEGNDLADVAVTIKVEQPNGIAETIANGVNDSTGKQTLDGNKFEFIHEGSNDRYIFYQPPAGKYSINIDKADPCKDISILSGTRGVTAKLISPDDGAVFTENDIKPYYDAADPKKFSFQLNQMDQNGQIFPLREIDNYPPTMKVTLSNRDGSPLQIPMPEYTIKLVDVNNAVYESVEPISLQYPGKFTWDFVFQTNNPRPEISAPVTVTTMQGNLEIKPLVRKFNFTVLTTLSDAVIFSDKEENQTISVQIQVNDDRDNRPLRKDLQIADSTQAPFVAVLETVDSNGKATNEIDSQAMKWEAGNSYSVTLSAPSNGQFAGDKYRLRIVLTDDYNKIFYTSVEPITFEKVFSITQVKEQPFQWDVASPQNDAFYSIRTPLNWFAKPNIDAVLSIEARNSIDNKAIASAMMIKSGGPAALFKGTLRSLASGQTYEIEFAPVASVGADASKDVTTRFTAAWPKDAPLKGDFYLESLTLEQNNLSRAWVEPKQLAQLPIHFTLKETFWTSPWSLLALISLILIGVVGIAFLVLQFGPLYGCTLTFVPEREAQQPVSGELLAWRFFRTRGLTYKKSKINEKLSGAFDISSILIIADHPSVPGARAAANVDINYEDGNSMPIPNINEGDEVHVSIGQLMILSRRSLGLVDRIFQFLPVLLVTAIMVAVWLAIFMFLFLKS